MNDNDHKDYYEILGIQKDSCQSDIKKAFYKLSLVFHPDKGGSEDIFKEINEAYSTLSDSNKKRAYDIKQEQILASKIKKNDFMHTCKITLKDVYFGTIKKFKVQRNKPCNSCFKSCNTCNGSGLVIQTINFGPFNHQIQQHCHVCHGNCKKLEKSNSCPCKNGYLLEEQIFEINIKSGINDREQFVFKEWGEQPNNKNEIAGNFIVIINIEQDKLFTRNGLNLYCTLKITLRESIISKIINIQHFDELISIDTKGFGILNPNKYYILYNKGLTQQGNLYIKFDIDYPERTFNLDQLKLLQDTFDLVNF